MTEIVYILTNPSMPDLIKIGRTNKTLEERISSLSNHSGVPVPFEVFYACEVEDNADIEKRLHFAFGDHRINPKREFFRVNPERVQMILEAVAIRDVTPNSDIVEDETDLQTLQRARSRRPVFRFSMVDIPVGSLLHFIKDENVTCKVVDDKKVEFEGKETSLSDCAKIMMHRHGGKLTERQGPLYWLYKIETLDERRIRLEEEDDSCLRSNP